MVDGRGVNRTIVKGRVEEAGKRWDGFTQKMLKVKA
jgi:hypothetical protein